MKYIFLILTFILGISSCKDNKISPSQISLDDFEGTYEWTTANGEWTANGSYPTFILTANPRTTFEGVEVVDLNFEFSRVITDLEIVDENSYRGLCRWSQGPIADRKVRGDALIFRDPSGVNKLKIELNTGETLRAEEI